LADLHSNRPGSKGIRIRLPDQLLNLERIRIDLHDIRGLSSWSRASLPRTEERTIRRPSDIVDAKTDRDGITLRRRLSARQPEERLASPCRDIEPLAVFRYFETIGPGRLAARND